MHVYGPVFQVRLALQRAPSPGPLLLCITVFGYFWAICTGRAVLLHRLAGMLGVHEYTVIVELSDLKNPMGVVRIAD